MISFPKMSALCQLQLRQNLAMESKPRLRVEQMMCALLDEGSGDVVHPVKALSLVMTRWLP